MRLPLVLAAALAACSSPTRPAIGPAASSSLPASPSLDAPALPQSAAAPVPRPAVARTMDVVDREHGLEAPDPYRWMEGAQNPERDAWMRAQGAIAEAQLAKLPGRERLRARLRELVLGGGAVFDVQVAGKRMFYEQVPPGEQLARLVVRDATGADRVLVAPAATSVEGSHASLHAYSPSRDGARVAYVVSSGGSELGTLHVMDVATGKDLDDTIDRVWGEGAAAWLPDGKGFFYTRTPASGDDPLGMQTTWLHELGKPVEHDTEILGRGPGAALALAPGEWPSIWVPPDGGWVLAQVGGARSEQRIALAKLSELDRTGGGKTPWREIASYADGLEVTIVHGDRIYYLGFGSAPNRRVISVPLAHPELANARVEIAEDPDVPLVAMYGARDALYLLRRPNGRAELLRWPWSGKPASLDLPVAGWIPDAASDLRRDGITFQLETWLAPGTYFHFDPSTRRVAPIGLSSTTTADMSRVTAEELEAVSADGTHVPLTILHAKDLALDGSHPAILYGYGAYGVSQSPRFSASRLAWIERGGVYAIAHTRGGGERGRRWQDDGSRANKLNGIHDFLACGEYLVSHGYTTRSKLAAQGESMGGLMVGRALTEQPDLFAAANVSVGFVNPLRLDHAENGANQKAELGDPATEAGYRMLYEIDPYQHVRHTGYPATLFTVGLLDHRVAPWMTAKMAARMLALETGGRPVLVRIDPDAGHGIGSTRDQSLAERADVWSFFLAAFGDPDFTPRSGPP
jgi:prolyl oligopeptidase